MDSNTEKELKTILECDVQRDTRFWTILMDNEKLIAWRHPVAFRIF
jgi:hypothetical protein